jgi:hypothetical protein
VFFNYPDWVLFMRGMRFCLGTRIHGTVAALLAGVPALLICHDSRTTELARSMNIPHLPATELDTDRDLDPHRLEAIRTGLREQLVACEAGFPAYYERFLDYLDATGLAVADGFGRTAPRSRHVG